MSISEEFVKGQIKSLEMQRDQAHATFMQCTGAISILNEQINMIRMQESQEDDLLIPDKELGISEGKKIPAKTLAKAAKKPGKEGKES
jgi:hypothetical protein